MRGRLSNPLERAVIEDELLEIGRRLRLPAGCYDTDTDDDTDDDTDADDDTDYDYADDADTDDAKADDADAPKTTLKLKLNGEKMVTGLVVVQVPGRTGWRVTLVAWAREVRPDEWELVNARVIRREDYSTTRVGLEGLAKGPAEGYLLSEPCTEYAHRFDITRPRRADEKGWAKECPRPEGWVE